VVTFAMLSVSGSWYATDYLSLDQSRYRSCHGYGKLSFADCNLIVRALDFLILESSID
jgi:hypothetical protein